MSHEHEHEHEHDPAERGHPAAPPELARTLRRVVVIAIIASFGIAALAGIAVLLGGMRSDAAGQVLATTSLTGVLSVAVLCGAALLGKRAQAFGWVAIAVSLVMLGRSLWLIWGDPDWSDHSFRLTLTMAILTAACAVASLLLLLVEHERRAVRVSLFATLALMALGVLLSLALVWEVGREYSSPGHDAFYERLWQTAGIVWILAALGIVVVPVVSLLLRDSTASAATAAQAANAALAPASAPGAAPQLSAESRRRLADAAQAAGITPDELVDRLLR